MAIGKQDCGGNSGKGTKITAFMSILLETDIWKACVCR